MYNSVHILSDNSVWYIMIASQIAVDLGHSTVY